VAVLTVVKTLHRCMTGTNLSVTFKCIIEAVEAKCKRGKMSHIPADDQWF